MQQIDYMDSTGTLETATGASATHKQVNAYMRKGWNGYIL